MKNITVSVEDDVYHRARVRASELRTSVSALVRQHLENLSKEESATERLKRRETAIMQRIQRRGVVFRAAARLPRDEIHDRDAVR
jgi:NADH:ubiquinone oxidoreductase subunit D